MGHGLLTRSTAEARKTSREGGGRRGRSDRPRRGSTTGRHCAYKAPASTRRRGRMAIVKASEDWWALWIGLLVFALSLCTLAGADLLGWGVTTQVWLSPAKALAPVSKAYAALPGVASLALTYLFLLAVMTGGAAALGLDAKRFAAGFSVILWASWLCWLAGNNAYVAATPAKRAGFGIGWPLSLPGEAGFILALAARRRAGNRPPCAPTRPPAPPPP